MFNIFFLVCLFVFPFYSFADFCEGTFGTRLYYEELARRQGIEDSQFHPGFIDARRERKLVSTWNEPPDLPFLLNVLLPPDAHFIKRQMFLPGTPSAVKMREPGDALMARVHYTYNHRDPKTKKESKHRLSTNVVFSVRALVDNMRNPREDNWLVGRNAKAAILYLHGGGTQSTGGHSAAKLVSHFSRYGVDVVGLDLGWHGQGHREFFGFESEIKALSNFVKKYIPPNVPLFVWGHSWGGVFADQLMTMTDRAPNDFFFHSNFKGVMVMSTAVDSAPGKTVEEKLRAFNEKLIIAKETAQEVGNPIERDIFKNMAEEGKFSIQGNWYSTGTIIQLDHTIPSHQGRLYIPGMMVVGIHDTLVYHAWKDLYHARYDNLENLVPHYLDKGLYEISRNKWEMMEIGHLIGEFRSPNVDGKRGGYIQYELAMDFMETQLKLYPIRQAILKAERENQSGVPLEMEVRKRINYLPSFEAVREYVAREMRDVHQETVDRIINQIDMAERSSPLFTKLDKSYNEIPFVQVVKHTANDLGFRGFLTNYHYVRYVSNKSYRELKGNIPVRNSIRMILYPFSSPMRRAFQVLKELGKENSIHDLEFLKTELAWVIRKGEMPKNSPISRKLLEDLQLLQSMMMENSDKEKIREQAVFALENNAGFFGKTNLDVLPGKAIDLLEYVNSANRSLEEARVKMEEYEVPEPVVERVLKQKEILILSDNIAAGRYVPSMTELRPFLENRNEKTINRVKLVLDKLTEVVDTRIGVLERQEKLKIELQKSVNKYKELRQEVVNAIRTVNIGLKQARVKPPINLERFSAEMREELERLVEQQDKLEDLLNEFAAKIFAGEELEAANHIIATYEKHQQQIADYVALYEQYISNRKELDRKVITVMEEGKMDADYQTAVISVYGHESGGHTVRLDSGYTQLKNQTLRLAQLEKKVIDDKREETELMMEYDTLINQLLNLLTSKRGDGLFSSEREYEPGVDPNIAEIPHDHPTLERIRKASSLHSYSDIPMIRVLNGEHGLNNIIGNTLITDKVYVHRQRNGRVRGRRRGTWADKRAVVEYIQTHDDIFRDVLIKWEKAEAKLPPEVPLISPEVEQ